MDTALSLPLHRLPRLIGRAPSEQLVLIGQPQPIRIPERRWRSWLDNPEVLARFETKRYRRTDDLCWVWIGGVSSTGHGSFRAASLPGPTRRGTVPAHLFAYQLAHGVIPRLGWSGTVDAVISHRCDFAGCTNPTHIRLGTNATNCIEYLTRRGNLANPLADVRGAAGRTRAIAAAVRAGLANHEDAASIERRIIEAETGPSPHPMVMANAKGQLTASFVDSTGGHALSFFMLSKSETFVHERWATVERQRIHALLVAGGAAGADAPDCHHRDSRSVGGVEVAGFGRTRRW